MARRKLIAVFVIVALTSLANLLVNQVDVSDLGAYLLIFGLMIVPLLVLVGSTEGVGRADWEAMRQARRNRSPDS